MSSAGRLLCVSLATALDRYAEVDSLVVGGVNRPRIVLELAGGKGFNAARSAQRLGVRTRVLAVIGGPTGDQVRSLALAEGLETHWLDSDANTRQCLSLVSGDTGRLTEFYEPVEAAGPDLWHQLWAAFQSELDTLGPQDLVTLSRQPAGLPPDTLARLVDRCRLAGVPVAVDAYGPELALALPQGPTLVKVNEAEAREITGENASVVSSVAQQLLSMGAESVIITMGAAGSIYADNSSQVVVSHPPVPGGLAVGSGDAFLGALGVILTGTPLPPEVVALLPDAPTARMLALAAAAGMANARQLPAGQLTWPAVSAELSSITIRHATPWNPPTS